MMIGFPGAIFGLLAFFLREPERKVSAAVDTNYSRADWKKLLVNRAFILLCLGYSIFGLATNSLSIWGATFFSRLHKYDLPTIGFWAGVLTLAAGIPATLFAGAIADWFKKIGYTRMSFGMLIAFVSAPFWLVLLFADSVYLLLSAGFVLLATGLGWVGAAAADVTEIAGINLRGLGVAIFFFSVNIAAYLIGSNLIGLVNDRLGATEDPEMMRYALLVCPAACLMGALCLWRGSGILR